MSRVTSLRLSALGLLVAGAAIVWLSVPHHSGRPVHQASPRTPAEVRGRGAPVPGPNLDSSTSRSPPGSPAPLPFPVPDADAVERVAGKLESLDPGMPAYWVRAYLWGFADGLRAALGWPALSGGSGSAPAAPRTNPAPDLAPRVAAAAAKLGKEGLPFAVGALADPSRIRGRPQPPADAAADALATARLLTIGDLETLFERSSNTEMRAHLLTVALRQGAGDGAGIRLLREGLGDDQPRVAIEALRAVRAQAAGARGLEPHVRALLGSASPEVVEEAAVTLLAFDPRDAAAAAVIVGHLEAADPHGRERGIALLVEAGAAGHVLWPRLLPLLGDDAALDFVSPSPTVVPDRISWLAAQALVTLGARALAPRLLEIERGEKGRRRIAAGLVLLALGDPPPDVGKLVADALAWNDGETATGWAEAEALHLVPDLPRSRITPDLLDAMEKELATPRSRAAGACLLRLDAAGRGRAEAVLRGKGTAYERSGLLEALAAEPALGRGLEAALRHVASQDENSWNREKASEVLAAIPKEER